MPAEVHTTNGPLGPLYTIIAPTAEAVNGEIHNLSETAEAPLGFSLPVRMADGSWVSIGRKLP